MECVTVQYPVIEVYDDDMMSYTHPVSQELYIGAVVHNLRYSEYEWTITQSSTNIDQLEMNNILKGTMDKNINDEAYTGYAEVKVETRLLPANNWYIFQLKVWNEYGDSTATYNYTVVTGIVEGDLIVTPTEGTVLETKFTFTLGGYQFQNSSMYYEIYAYIDGTFDINDEFEDDDLSLDDDDFDYPKIDED